MKVHSKTRTAFVFSIALSAMLQALAVDVTISKQVLTVNEVATISVTDSTAQYYLATTPEHPCFIWSNPRSPATSRNMSYINGVVNNTYTTTYEIRAIRTGKVVFPRLTVNNGRTTKQAGPLSFEVREPIKNVDIPEKMVLLDVTWDGRQSPPDALYVGQPVSLMITFAVDQQLTILSGNSHPNSFATTENYFPDIELSGVTWRDFRSQSNQHSSQFLIVSNGKGNYQNRPMEIFRYRADFIPKNAGTLQGAIKHDVTILTGRMRRDVFGRVSISPNDMVRIDREIPFGPIEIRPLPSPDHKDAINTDLVGTFNVTIGLDKHKVKVGEGVGLTITITGNGNLEHFRAPSLVFPGFNVYDPEIKNNQVHGSGTATVEWVLIPRSESAELPELILTTFDPKRGQYRYHPASLKLEVLPSDNGNVTIRNRIVDSASEVIRQDEAQQKQADIGYVQPVLPEGYIALPVWKNGLRFYCFAGLGSVLGLLVFWGYMRRRQHLYQDPRAQRLAEAKKLKQIALRKLSGANEEEVKALVRREITQILAARQDAPPGTTTSELIDRIMDHTNDSEWVEILQAAEAGSYMPGAEKSLDRDRISRKLSSLSLSLIILFAAAMVSFTAPQAYGADTATPVVQSEEQLYSQGKFDEAYQAYRAMEQEGQGHADIAYNLGNCAFSLGHMGEAMGWYERSLRLDPTDAKTRANLNFVRSQLNLPPFDLSESPLDSLRHLRDHMRPDQWLKTGGCFFILMGISGLVLIVIRKNWLVIPLTFLLLGLLCGASAWRQKATTWKEGQAVVIHQSVPVYRLPSEGQAGTVNLHEAQELTILNERDGWYHALAGEHEGWVKTNAVLVYW